MSRRDIRGLILVGGFDTTVNLIAGGAHTLLRHPEVLRYQTRVQFILRIPREPVSGRGI